MSSVFLRLAEALVGGTLNPLEVSGSLCVDPRIVFLSTSNAPRNDSNSVISAVSTQVDGATRVTLASVLSRLVRADHVLGDLSRIVPCALSGGEDWKINLLQDWRDRSTLAGSSPSTGGNGGSAELIGGVVPGQANWGNRVAECDST